MLSVNNVTIHFGGLCAVNNVSMQVKSKSITGLIGPNGAGKTTFFNIISGVYKPDGGTIDLNGENLVGLQPYQITKRGMARTYQVINLFRKMSVVENVMVGEHCRMKSGYFSAVFRTKEQRREEQEIYEKALEWLDFVGLKEHAAEQAGSLPYGDQRKLEIARALASGPEILLLDEPAAGMNSAEKEDLIGLLRKISGKGISILIIEHDMRLMMGVADYIYVLDYGKKIAEGVAQEIQNNEDVIKAYLGGDE